LIWLNSTHGAPGAADRKDNRPLGRGSGRFRYRYRALRYRVERQGYHCERDCLVPNAEVIVTSK
jgi:hypothetical protein